MYRSPCSKNGLVLDFGLRVQAVRGLGFRVKFMGELLRQAIYQHPVFGRLAPVILGTPERKNALPRGLEKRKMHFRDSGTVQCVLHGILRSDRVSNL